MSRIPFPNIVIRPGTHLDTHLSLQPFSRCTVPLVCPASMHILIAICTMQCSCYGWQESGHNLITPSAAPIRITNRCKTASRFQGVSGMDSALT